MKRLLATLLPVLALLAGSSCTLSKIPEVRTMPAAQTLDTEPVRARNLSAVQEYFRFQGEKDLDGWIALWAEDGVFVIAYPPAGFPARIEGRAAIGPLYRQLFEGYAEVRFRDLEIRPLLDPDRFVATWITDLDLVAGGTYVNTLLGLFTFRDGKLSRYDEYFDPRPFEKAQAAVHQDGR